MCGICGIIDPEGIPIASLHRMSEILSHRGPDDEGFLLLDSSNIPVVLRGNDTIPELRSLQHIEEIKNEVIIAGFAHRRLSIIDLSPQGHQPMDYSNKEYYIAFNGEVYNYKEIHQELTNLGYSFRSQSDTEVILAAYIHWGVECVSHFVGMWAFVIVDLVHKHVFLSRDRFGIKPLYYTIKGRRLAFASEIKALLGTGLAQPRLNVQKLTEFLIYGNTADPSGNLFSEIQVLPEGHNLISSIMQPNDVKLISYYNLKEAVSRVHVDDKQPVDRFRSLFNESVELHLRSDVPVGVNLSGGLDSSSIVAFMAGRMGIEQFHTFTAAYDNENVDESGYAKIVAGQFTNVKPYFTYPSIHNFWKDLDQQIWHHDLPFHSTSMHAQWEVMKLAKSYGIKVLLNGQGSDEMLGGYSPFAGQFLIDLLRQKRLKLFWHEYFELKRNFTPAVNYAILRASYAWLPDELKGLARRQFRLGHEFLSDSFLREVGNIKPPVLHGRNFNEMSILSIKFGLQHLLRYEDRLSMAFSIESRVPFLDHRLVEYSVSLDPCYKIMNGWTKYVLRKNLESALPAKVTWRKGKMGFLTPAREWKNELERELHAYIEDSTFPDFINKVALLKACNTDFNQPTKVSEFWKMIVTLKWAEKFKVYV